MAPFTFQGTMKRGQFIAHYLMLVVVLIALTAAAMFSLETAAAGLGFVMLLMMLPVTVYGYAIMTQRTRDTGLNPYLVLVMLIPYVGFAFLILLMVAKTDAFKSKEASK